ncbi:hypothetical protein QBC40DRAFT_286026, partial [Triangularia verruculosa]
IACLTSIGWLTTCRSVAVDPSCGLLVVCRVTDATVLEDLTSLAVPSEEQSFTNSFTVGLVHLYHKFIGRHIHTADKREFLPNTIRYTNEGIFRVLKLLCTLVASLLPVLGIFVLNRIKTMESRIGAVAAFTALFSFSLSLLTSAHVKDVFAATAAFAAVLVVFVGTTDISSSAA